MAFENIGPLALNAANTRANFMLQIQQLKEGIRQASLQRFNSLIDFKLQTDAQKSARKTASRKAQQQQIIQMASLLALGVVGGIPGVPGLFGSGAATTSVAGTQFTGGLQGAAGAGGNKGLFDFISLAAGG